ncbi:MAG: tRNA uridine-5-carboxymethylaminomethyl(34) synthesis GTPase MnmE [Puniceicoccales bacterium]|jgi:tRNA modification GTPase|nr:tRNA uridine-5-carboxymethylaminomethyl(34) synthesis GTPase MnmE [Puniceicoccales bacterium]
MGGDSPFAAASTPGGISAIAVLRFSGCGCRKIFKEIFSRDPCPRVATFAPYRNRAGIHLDDVVVTYFFGPTSYTGEDLVEISCHGNPSIVHRILEDLYGRGCRPAEPGEFTRTAFLNGKLDLAQAEAVADLIHARSEAALAFARQQLDGSLGRELSPQVSILVDLLATVEAHIDFSEEEPTAPVLTLQRNLDPVRRTLEKLLGTLRHRHHVEKGVAVAFMGAPNAGKSTLWNGFLGRERALVSPIAGTTRDFLEEEIFLGPWNLRIIDTAGLRETDDELEALSMERSREKIIGADLLLWVIDGSGPLDRALSSREEWWSHRSSGILILSKRDLPATIGRDHPFLREIGWPTVEISARRPEDIESLKCFLIKYLTEKDLIPNEEQVLVNQRQAEHLREAVAALAVAETLSLEKGELVAAELRRALDALATITGEKIDGVILDRIFGKFCIGK